MVQVKRSGMEAFVVEITDSIKIKQIPLGDNAK